MEREPEVHIGLMQTVPEILVNLHGQWSISGGLAGAGLEIKRFQDLHLKFYVANPTHGKSTSQRYTVKLTEIRSSESIGRWLPVAKSIGVESNLSILDAGKLWSILGKTWDARTRWIVAGNYGSHDEAAEAGRE